MIINKKVSFIIERCYNKPINNTFTTSNIKIINCHDNIPFKQKEGNNKEKNIFDLILQLMIIMKKFLQTIKI